MKSVLVAQDYSAPQELTLAGLSLILMNRVSTKVIHHWQISLSTALTTLIKASLAFRHIQISFNISTPNEQASRLLRSHRHLCSLAFSSVIRGAPCNCCIIFLKALIGAHSLVFSSEDLGCCRANLCDVLGRSRSPAARARGLFFLLCTKACDQHQTRVAAFSSHIKIQRFSPALCFATFGFN